MEKKGGKKKGGKKRWKKTVKKVKKKGECKRVHAKGGGCKR